MRQALAVLLVFLSALPSAPVLAQDHLVTSQDAAARLLSAAAQRRLDADALRALLLTPAAQAVTARMRVDPARLQAGVGSLSDTELRDLAARAAALSSDPRAGLVDHEIHELIVIFLIVAIVILVIKAVD
jgi:hypothetical protein